MTRLSAISDRHRSPVAKEPSAYPTAAATKHANVARLQAMAAAPAEAGGAAEEVAWDVGGNLTSLIAKEKS